jgi:uncharacterized protein YbjT (DUF2867 family)
VRSASRYGVGEEMRAALQGATTLFLVPAAESADRVEQHRTAVDSAVAAGVERIVYLSFVDAGPAATFTLARHHWATEEHIRAAGVRFTFPRMNMYLDFMPRMVGPDGVIAGPAGDGRAALVARHDVADAAAAILTGEGHDGQTYDVTGREALTMTQVAAQLAELSGKPISYRAETIEEAWASRASYGAPDWEVEGWVTSYAAIAAGDLESISDTVERLAGHQPMTLAEYIRAQDIRPAAD